MTAASAAVVRQAFSRLPTALKPLRYHIRLKPDLQAFTFKGWLTVDLHVLKETAQIVCNAAELDIQQVRLLGGDGSNLPFKLNEEAETLTIDLPNPLSEDKKVSLYCAYTGTLNDQLRGFYRSKYTVNGEERYCATTQFESTEARRCFPCWDEPAVKATFTISVIAPTDRVALSNMPVVPEAVGGDATLDEVTVGEVDEKHRLVRFSESPVMSTYLVAIIVGEFEAIKGRTTKGNIVEVSVFTPMGKTEQGKFALETAIKALEFYTDFFDVEYPLPKYDLIAIADFQCGAMENWGLVTYRESCVLVDPENTASDSLQWVAIVVSHETAHQWFGNLVTMDWWTGFASFMENYCTNALFPQFDLWSQFVSNTMIDALELDALENSHPIEVVVGHPSEVDEIFDNISYNKGASVIRMLHEYIGNDSFRKGMKAYLEEFTYKNAETEDLWRSLEKASGKPVKNIMSTWTSQMGFPVIKIEVAEQDGDTMKLTISQSKFNADGSSSDSYTWKVPINVITEADAESPHRFLLEDKTAQITIPNAKGQWVKLNNDFVGYYRVQYPQEMLDRFLPVIKQQKLGAINRLSLLDDLMALVQAGLASSDVALKMISAYTGENSYVVWRCIGNCFLKLRIILADEDFLDDFNAFMKTTMAEIVDQVGWKSVANEHHTQTLLRMMVISRMGSLGHENTVKEARRRFEAHVSGGEQIPADLRGSVYRVVAANGNEENFQQLVKLFKASDLHEEKDRISSAMGAFQKPEILEKVLAFSLSDDVRSQDTPFVVCSVANNAKGRDLAWDFFQNNFDLFLERYKTGMLMSRMVKGTTDSFTTEERALEVEKFFQEHKNPAERNVKQSIETIRLNASWLKRDREKIRDFLKAHQQ